MTTLYGLFLLMIIGALLCLAIPFFKHGKIKSFTMCAAFMLIFSFILYKEKGQPPGLNFWLTQGQQHYYLQQQFLQLGGIDAIITRIEAKLAQHPQDVQGWLILGKLYLSKQDKEKAFRAFTYAHKLDPANAEATRYYEATK